MADAQQSDAENAQSDRPSFLSFWKKGKGKGKQKKDGGSGSGGTSSGGGGGGGSGSGGKKSSTCEF